jgi:hypothetical protein
MDWLEALRLRQDIQLNPPERLYRQLVLWVQLLWQDNEEVPEKFDLSVWLHQILSLILLQD